MSLVSQLFYVSAATRPFDGGVVAAILNQARRNNPARDVTGCLLYSGRYFAQVLEARAEIIDDMETRLDLDPRHRHVKVLSRTSSPTRSYGDFSMGYMHSLDMQDALERLIFDVEPDLQLLERTRRAIRPDPVTGLI